MLKILSKQFYKMDAEIKAEQIAECYGRFISLSSIEALCANYSSFNFYPYKTQNYSRCQHKKYVTVLEYERREAKAYKRWERNEIRLLPYTIYDNSRNK